jgi:phosphohistidine swiveling domain-containing protein
VKWQWLHEGPDDPTKGDMSAKALALARAARAGLPVPRGLVLGLDDAIADPDAIAAPLAELLAAGSVIVRSALAGEDTSDQSGAGLGVSIGGCTTAAHVHDALVALRAHRSDPVLERYFGARGHARDQVIVQTQIAARWIVVAAIEPDAAHVEVHAPTGDPLATGATPSWSGPPDLWPAPAKGALSRLARAAVRVAVPSAYGHDLEIAIDDADAAWLVQSRPLTAPLHPGWPDFLAELRRRGEAGALTGSLVLDAEHNPAPLSFAHAWLVQWLAAQRPAAGGLVVLAGWLYTRTLVRDLPGTAAGSSTSPRPSPRAVLQRLRTDVMPAARARLAAIEARVAGADDDALRSAFADACAAFLAMIDVYLGELIPARRGWESREAIAHPHSRTDPLAVIERAHDLDVLPAAWDVASPPLGPRPTAVVRPTSADEPEISEEVAAMLLREWDDHLFALGLAPVRAAWLALGERLGLGDDAFLLGGDELLAALEHGVNAGVLPARRAACRRALALAPPPRILEGRPAGPPARPLHGMPIGPSHTGPVAQRRDLADLQARPPAADAIVVVPTLTAPAALVVHALGLRAVVCEWGGALSHAALIARELGLSALIGCRGATSVHDGTLAVLDTRAGRLRTLPG